VLFSWVRGKQSGRRSRLEQYYGGRKPSGVFFKRRVCSIHRGRRSQSQPWFGRTSAEHARSLAVTPPVVGWAEQGDVRGSCGLRCRLAAQTKKSFRHFAFRLSNSLLHAAPRRRTTTPTARPRICGRLNQAGSSSFSPTTVSIEPPRSRNIRSPPVQGLSSSRKIHRTNRISQAGAAWLSRIRIRQ